MASRAACCSLEVLLFQIPKRTAMQYCKLAAANSWARFPRPEYQICVTGDGSTDKWSELIAPVGGRCRTHTRTLKNTSMINDLNEAIRQSATSLRLDVRAARTFIQTCA